MNEDETPPQPGHGWGPRPWQPRWPGWRPGPVVVPVPVYRRLPERSPTSETPPVVQVETATDWTSDILKGAAAGLVVAVVAPLVLRAVGYGR